MQIETLNRLYLELSQVVTAKTARELRLEKQVAILKNACAVADAMAGHVCVDVVELRAREDSVSCEQYFKATCASARQALKLVKDLELEEKRRECKVEIAKAGFEEPDLRGSQPWGDLYPR